jgi:hypothetical protein
MGCAVITINVKIGDFRHKQQILLSHICLTVSKLAVLTTSGKTCEREFVGIKHNLYQFSAPSVELLQVMFAVEVL